MEFGEIYHKNADDLIITKTCLITHPDGDIVRSDVIVVGDIRCVTAVIQIWLRACPHTRGMDRIAMKQMKRTDLMVLVA